MSCGAADEGSAALFVCGGGGTDLAPARGTCRTDGRGGIGGRMMTCGRRWIEEPRLFDRKSDDFPSQSLLTSGLDGRPSSSLHCSHACIIRMPPMPMRLSARQVPRRRSQILGLEDGRSGLDLPEADRREIVVCGRGECVGGRGEGLDSPGGRIGVSLLTGAKFGDRMKKIFSEFFVLDFMRTEKFREDIV